MSPGDLFQVDQTPVGVETLEAQDTSPGSREPEMARLVCAVALSTGCRGAKPLQRRFPRTQGKQGRPGGAA